MYLFIYAFLIILYLVVCKNPGRDNAKRIYIALTTSLLCFLTTFRNLAVGNDTYGYYLRFRNADNESWRDLIQKVSDSLFGNTLYYRDAGYEIIQKFMNTILFGSFELYQFVIALALLCAIAHLIHRYVDEFYCYPLSYAIYVSLFYHFLPNSTIRQSIALTLFLWAAILWVERKWIIRASLLLVLAFTVHKTSFICILPFLLMKVKNKNSFALFTVVGFFVLFAIGKAVVAWMAGIGDETDGYYSQQYAKSTYYDKNSTPYMFIIQMFVYLFVGLLHRAPLNDLSEELQFATVSFYLGVLLAPLIWVDPNMLRLGAYFTIWAIVFVPNSLKNYETSHYRQIVIVALYCMTFGRPFLSGNQPYKFKWEQMKLQKSYDKIFAEPI